MGEDSRKGWIAGFWRRSFAFLIDSVILSCVGYAAGLLLEDFFVHHRLWGRLIGLAIGLGYFGLMDSRIGNGQTLGKRLLKVRVVDAGNATVGLQRALGRYGVVALPNLLEGSVIFPGSGFNYPWVAVAFVIVLIATVDAYFYVFNRGTRQSLHDLLFGTYVANVDTELEPRSVWPQHRFIAAGICVALCASSLAGLKFMNEPPFSDMLAARGALMRDPLVSEASVAYNETSTRTASGDVEKTSYFGATLTIDENRIADEQFARSKAKILIEAYPEATRGGVVVIDLVYGYDIGISSFSQNRRHTFKIEELGAG